MKPVNFSAGPAALPKQVNSGLRTALTNYADTGFSILELSHRSPQISSMITDTSKRLRGLLNIPDAYHILWLPGGASLQFSMIPMNLTGHDSVFSYVDTGYWSQKAIKEAARFGTVNISGTSRGESYASIPRNIYPDNQSRYLHITSNNTIYGTQYKVYPKLNKGYLIADMSSDICSREIPIEQFGLIYAGAQKNLGPAGVCLVILHDGLLEQMTSDVPAMLNYRNHVAKQSCYNTPPVYAIYGVNLMLQWIEGQGGIATLETRNHRKAKLLYDEIDRNALFYGIADAIDRSEMNIVFRCLNESLEAPFITFCEANELYFIKGHRSVGGLRASIYNAIEIPDVERLVRCMQEFEARYQ